MPEKKFLIELNIWERKLCCVDTVDTTGVVIEATDFDDDESQKLFRFGNPAEDVEDDEVVGEICFGTLSSEITIIFLGVSVVVVVG